MPPIPENRPRKGPLTDTFLKTAKPGEKPYRISAGSSLYLEVTPSGSKLWRLKYRMDGKESRFAIGAYPKILLKEARDRAEEAREQIALGIHPSHKKKADRVSQGLERSNTFESIAEEWIKSKDWQEISKERRRGLFKLHVYPAIGKFPVKQITSAQILAILTDIAVKRAAPSIAAEARRSMSGVFELAVATLRATVDPVYPVRRAIKPNKTQHRRPLSEIEIGTLLRDFHQRHGGHLANSAFRLMWLTICRPSEAVEAEWSEFDLENALWRIQSQRMKLGIGHIVPLPTQAVEMLRALKGITGNYVHVFPHRDYRERPMTLATLRQAIYALGWRGKYSPHATRATGSTRLNEMGFNSDWVEMQLAHGDIDPVRASYNFAEYMNGRAKMMQHWADYLDALAAGRKVVAGNFGRLLNPAR